MEIENVDLRERLLGRPWVSRVVDLAGGCEVQLLPGWQYVRVESAYRTENVGCLGALAVFPSVEVAVVCTGRDAVRYGHPFGPRGIDRAFGGDVVAVACEGGRPWPVIRVGVVGGEWPATSPKGEIPGWRDVTAMGAPHVFRDFDCLSGSSWYWGEKSKLERAATNLIEWACLRLDYVDGVGDGVCVYGDLLVGYRRNRRCLALASGAGIQLVRGVLRREGWRGVYRYCGWSMSRYMAAGNASALLWSRYAMGGHSWSV